MLRTLLCAFCFASIFRIHAQTLPALEFDVASIKARATCDGGDGIRSHPGSFELLNMEPTTILSNTYNLRLEDISGAPSWADKICYDIKGKADEDPSMDPALARERNKLRIQSLLAKRFSLKFHWDTKIEDGYVLVVSKKGLPLKPSAPETKHFTAQGRGSLRCDSCSTLALTVFLANFLAKPVHDETSIQGIYDMNLAFEPVNAEQNPDSALPALFTAVQELGLKLESRKIPVKIFVIDHIEPPTEN